MNGSGCRQIIIQKDPLVGLWNETLKYKTKCGFFLRSVLKSDRFFMFATDVNTYFHTEH